jgi:hypothetical protein
MRGKNAQVKGTSEKSLANDLTPARGAGNVLVVSRTREHTDRLPHTDGGNHMFKVTDVAAPVAQRGRTAQPVNPDLANALQDALKSGKFVNLSGTPSEVSHDVADVKKWKGAHPEALIKFHTISKDANDKVTATQVVVRLLAPATPEPVKAGK